MGDEFEQEVMRQTARKIASTLSDVSSATGRLFWLGVMKEVVRILETGEP